MPELGRLRRPSGAINEMKAQPVFNEFVAGLADAGLKSLAIELAAEVEELMEREGLCGCRADPGAGHRIFDELAAEAGGTAAGHVG